MLFAVPHELALLDSPEYGLPCLADVGVGDFAMQTFTPLPGAQ